MNPINGIVRVLGVVFTLIITFVVILAAIRYIGIPIICAIFQIPNPWG